MTVWPLTLEILVTFALSATLIYRYGNWIQQNLFTTVSVFIAWFFSFIVIFILPLDISTTSYRQCLELHPVVTPSPHPSTPWSNVTVAPPLPANGTNTSAVSSASFLLTTPVPLVDDYCQMPWSYVQEQVLQTLWRIVYWTSQILTWLVLPLMQSYSMAGDFTVSGKLKSALFENAIYYGSFAAIFLVLLLYVSVKIGLSWNGLKIICITASNTWGLFLLVVLLGYGLVEIPRSCLNTSQYARTLSYLYFKVAKLSAEKCEADEKLDDILEEIQNAADSLGGIYDPYRQFLDVIVEKCPPEWAQRLQTRQQTNSGYNNARITGSAYNEKSFIRMHQTLNRAMQTHHRTHCQWNYLIEKAIEWEDVAKNEISPLRIYKSSLNTKQSQSQWSRFYRDNLYTPIVEWYWKCLIRGPIFRVLGYILTVFSLMVVWSEMTFSIQSPPLSIFALLIKGFDLHYILIEIFSMLSIAYLCVCAYYTVFKVRIFNYYYLASHHQTDEYSLIFCGMLLCRLTPPLCLNFLGLIHMDSHITHKVGMLETSFTKIMGHLDVISFINDSFNIYLPICICLFCLATFFQFGSKLLHNLGFEQFILNDELTTELIREGQDLVKREKAKRQRQQDVETSRSLKFRQTVDNSQQSTVNNHNVLSRTPSDDVRQELLNDVEPVDYSTSWSGYGSGARPQKGIFDDV